MNKHKVSKRQFKTVIIAFSIAFIWLSIGGLHALGYDKENNNCKDMSKNLEDTLEAIGIPVTIVRGQNDDAGHMWIRIAGFDIDSVFIIPFPNSVSYPELQMEFNDYDNYLGSKP